MNMTTYFKPLRQKVGVVTLAISCLLMSGWVRSQSMQDTFAVRTGSAYRFKLVSAWQRLVFVIIHIDSNEQFTFTFWTSESAVRSEWRLLLVPPVPTLSFRIDNRFLATGNGVAQFGNTKISADSFHLPYWSVVIPLTLLSAWLLLSKPRQTKPSTEPPA